MNVQQWVRPAALPGDGPAHAIAGIFAAELQIPSIQPTTTSSISAATR